MASRDENPRSSWESLYGLVRGHVLQSLEFEGRHAVEHTAAAQESEVWCSENLGHIPALLAVHDFQDLHMIYLPSAQHDQDGLNHPRWGWNLLIPWQ